MTDESDLLAATHGTIPCSEITAFFAFDVATGEPALGLALHTHSEWPWGGSDTLVIGVPRSRLGDLLGELTDAAERVYSAAHGEDDDGAALPSGE